MISTTRNVIRSAAFALAISAIVLLCGRVRSDGPEFGGTVVIAVSSDPGGLNSAITTQGGLQMICGSIFSGLAAQDFDLSPASDFRNGGEAG